MNKLRLKEDGGDLGARAIVYKFSARRETRLHPSDADTGMAAQVRRDGYPLFAYLAQMEDTLTTALKWFASGSGMIAALMVSLDLGRRVTGWGFVIFVASSIAWIAGSALTRDFALGTQNIALFGINLFGVYRYLIRKKLNG